MIERLQAKRNEEGFTLIELLIVIIVLGILAAIVVFAVQGTKKDAIAATCKTDVKSIELSAESVLAKQSNNYTSLANVVQGDLDDETKGGLLKAFPTNGAYTLAWDNTATPPAVTVAGSNGETSCAAFES